MDPSRTRPPDSMGPVEVLDLLPLAILLFDAEGRCTHANGLALSRWGRPPLEGRTVTEVFTGRDAEIARAIGGCLGPGPVPAEVARLARAEGDVQLLRVRGGALVIAHPPVVRPVPGVPAPAGGAAMRDLAHILVQPLGLISNWAELVRGMTSGDAARYAEKIGALARATAEEMRAAVQAGAQPATAARPPGDGGAAGPGDAV